MQGKMQGMRVVITACKASAGCMRVHECMSAGCMDAGGFCHAAAMHARAPDCTPSIGLPAAERQAFQADCSVEATLLVQLCHAVHFAAGRSPALQSAAGPLAGCTRPAVASLAASFCRQQQMIASIVECMLWQCCPLQSLRCLRGMLLAESLCGVCGDRVLGGLSSLPFSASAVWQGTLGPKERGL